MNATNVITAGEALMPASRSNAEDGWTSWRGFFRGVDVVGGHVAQARDSKRGRANGATSVANLNLLDLTHDAVCALGKGCVIEYWSRGAEQLYGWTADEAVGRVSHVLLKTRFPVPFEHIAAELRRTGCWEGELEHTRRDGARVAVASRWCLLRDEVSSPSAILEMNSNVTERKRAEAERAELAERLRQAEKLESIGRFASGIVHDVNNVLGGIMAYGEMLFDEAPDDTPRRRYAENVMTAATRGRDLVEQILAYTRGQRRERAPTDVRRAVLETLELVRCSMPASIALQVAIPAVPLVAMGNATQLHQVVMNLCSNSIHAMKAGGRLHVEVTPLDVEVDCRASHGRLSPGRYVRVAVEDSGCGMDEATLARIFEPFFTTKEAGCGTGLGLALVHEIVADLGGAIDVKSAPGEGSTFSIYIPMADVGAA